MLNDTYFVSEAISDLLRTKRVEILDHQPYIVNPLSVSAQPSDKKGLMLDLGHVNCQRAQPSEDARLARKQHYRAVRIAEKISSVCKVTFLL